MIAPTSPSSLPEQLSIICLGEGKVPRTGSGLDRQQLAASPSDVASRDAMDDPVDARRGRAEVRSSGPTEKTSDILEIQLDGRMWRVRAPARISPFGGKYGWRGLHDVKVNDQTVSGVISYSLVRQATLTLARATGQVALLGARTSFFGMCDTLVSGILPTSTSNEKAAP